MSVVLKYPLTPVTLSISHVDGTMQSTRKVALLINLESRIASIPPVLVNTTIIDASFFLHLQINITLPATFGEISRFLLRKIMSPEVDTVHFITDKWLSPSIKDSERDSWDSSSALYKITGPAQRRFFRLKKQQLQGLIG